MRKHVAAFGVAAAVALVVSAAAVGRYYSAGKSSVTVMRSDERDTVIFAITNRTGAVTDYSQRVEAKIGDVWSVTEFGLGTKWQNPSFRSKFGIEPGKGIHLCVGIIPQAVLPKGTTAWRLRVELRPVPKQPTKWEVRRMLLAQKLAPNWPLLAERISPHRDATQTIYGPPMLGTTVLEPGS